MADPFWGNLYKSITDEELIEAAIARIAALYSTTLAFGTWGMVPKSQIDNSTIDEEIDLKIVAHNADEEAHLAAGQSLQSHKASEIIDHLARSVLVDKFAHDRYQYNSNFESIDSWQKTGNVILIGPNQIAIETTVVLNNFQWLTQLIQGYNENLWLLSNFPYWRTSVYFRNNTNQIAYIVHGSPDDDPGNEPFGYGFKVENGNLYALYYDADHVEQKTLISDINLASFNIYGCEVISSTHIKFYVNDVLVADLSGITLFSSSGYFLYYYIKTTNTSAKYMEIQDLVYDENRS